MLLEIDDNSILEWNKEYCLQITIKLSEDHSIIVPIDYNPSLHYKQVDWENMTQTGKLARLQAASDHILFNEIITVNWYG
jgi:hypothetical protein